MYLYMHGQCDDEYNMSDPLSAAAACNLSKAVNVVKFHAD